jgi:hypothetical protein
MPIKLQPADCFVGMFDIIGFKALREKNGTAGLYQQFTRGIIPAIQHSAAGRGKTENVNGVPVYVPDFSEGSVKFRAISDSVIFYTTDDSFDSFFKIVNSAFMLLQFGFNGGKAPYRGAIGWGDLIDDPNGILLGSAIEDAYAGESTQAWAGAMLTPACLGFASSKNYIDDYKTIHLKIAENLGDDVQKRNAIKNARKLVAYDVPTQFNPKDGPVEYGVLSTFAIDWTIRMYDGASKKSFDSSSNAHAKKIADNTVSFEQWARKSNQ